MKRVGLKVRLRGVYWRDWHYWDLWERVMVSNFILLHPSQLGILLPRHLYEICILGYNLHHYHSLYTRFCEGRRRPIRSLLADHAFAISRLMTSFFVR